jgi:hypothetical protein
MSFHPQMSWSPVVGHWVEIRRNGVTIDAGTVDAVTPNDDTLWLRAMGIATRRMFTRDPGLEVWIDYTWEHPQLNRQAESPGEYDSQRLNIDTDG